MTEIKTNEDSKKILQLIKRAIETESYEYTGRKGIIIYILEDIDGVVGSKYIKVNFEVEKW